MATKIGPNKHVAVTGANRGIGLEFTRQFLERGNQLYVGVRNPKDIKDLQSLQQKHTGQLEISQLDISKTSSIQDWVQWLSSKTDHLDVVIQNAGTYGAEDLEDLSAERMIEVFNVNCIGPVTSVQALVKAKLIGPPGSIVGTLTSKMGSITDNGSGGTYPYRASKAAMNAVNKSLSIDLAHRGVQCVLLHPGWVRTRMTNFSGLIDPDQSAGGLISVLESGKELQGQWYDYKHEAIPW